MNKRAKGTVYEEKAASYLEKMGYQLIEKNYRCKAGEIDLIARDGEYLVFVEVKYRTSAAAGYGMESVDFRKQRRIIRAAQWYLTVHRISPSQACRFDVVSFLGEQATLIRDAFQC